MRRNTSANILDLTKALGFRILYYPVIGSASDLFDYPLVRRRFRPSFSDIKEKFTSSQ